MLYFQASSLPDTFPNFFSFIFLNTFGIFVFFFSFIFFFGSVRVVSVFRG